MPACRAYTDWRARFYRRGAAQIPAEMGSGYGWGKTKAQGLSMHTGTRPSRWAHDDRRLRAINANTAAPGSSHTARVRARRAGSTAKAAGSPARPGCPPRRGWGTSQTLQAPHRPQTKGSIYLPPGGRALPVLRGGAPRARPGPARSRRRAGTARRGPARHGPSSPPRCCRAAGPRPAAKPSRPPRETAPRHQGSRRRRRRRPPSREPQRSGRPGRRRRQPRAALRPCASARNGGRAARR